MSSSSKNSDEKVCSPSVSKRHKSATVEHDDGAPSRGTCESREKFHSKWLPKLINYCLFYLFQYNTCLQ